MSGPDMVQAAVLGSLAAIVVLCVALAVLSRLGLVDHDGWVLRHERRRRRLHPRRRQAPTDFTAADMAAVRERQRRTERWFDLDDAVLATDWKAWEAMPTVPHPVEPPLSNDREEV